jgi:signal transduction histidine kinase
VLFRSYSFKVNIYRIIQELINNARKHAQAEKLFVQILIDKQTLLLTIEDDGIGFDRNTDEGKGLGLVNIRNRVIYFNGTLQIQGFPGKGACIYIEFDLNKIQ